MLPGALVIVRSKRLQDKRSNGSLFIRTRPEPRLNRFTCYNGAWYALMREGDHVDGAQAILLAMIPLPNTPITFYYVLFSSNQRLTWVASHEVELREVT